MNKFKFTITLAAAAILSIHSAYSQDIPNKATQVQGSVKHEKKSSISIERVSPSIAKIKFANAPVNLIVPETLFSLNEAIKQLSKDEKVKVVIVTSDVKGYFFNHFDTSEFPNFLQQVGESNKPLMVELMSNLSNAPFVTIASIHGRTQGGGNEVALAFDLRYASKEKAVFVQPEVGIGLFPGGGSVLQLTRLIGRDRAIEALLSSDDYSADLAEKYGWVTRSIPDAQLDNFVEKLANRLSTFDKTALMTTKNKSMESAFLKMMSY